MQTVVALIIVLVVLILILVLNCWCLWVGPRRGASGLHAHVRACYMQTVVVLVLVIFFVPVLVIFLIGFVRVVISILVGVYELDPGVVLIDYTRM